MGGPGIGAVVFLSDVSGQNHAQVNSSGRVLVDAIINGTLNVANIDVSGETLYLSNDGINNVVKMSGQTVVTSVSGNAVSLISGINTVFATSGSAVLIGVPGSTASVSTHGINDTTAASTV